MVDYLRIKSHSGCYATSMPSPITSQVISSIDMIAHTQEGKSLIYSRLITNINVHT